jgi:hypothetical protein
MKLNMRYGVVVIALTILITPAFADAVFTPGYHLQPNEQRILDPTSQTGSTVFGFTNNSNTQVQFSSATDTLGVIPVGIPKVTATDGLVNDLTITVPGFTFLNFVMRPFQPTANNDLTITVTMGDGSTFSYGPYGSTSGNNIFTITTIKGAVIKSVTIDSPGGFQDLRDAQVSGLAAVPEPSSLLLFGLSILGAAAVTRRK